MYQDKGETKQCKCIPWSVLQVQGYQREVQTEIESMSVRLEILSSGCNLERIAYTIYYILYTMPDAFFQSDKKRKRSKPGRAGPSSNSRPKAPRRQEKDEELESSAGEEGVDDMDFRAGRGGEDDMSDGEAIDENETAAEKRVRMAKGYLAKVRKELQDSESNTTIACLKLMR